MVSGLMSGVRERRYAVFPSAVALSLTILTLIILIVPYLSFSWFAPRMRLPLETASIFAAVLTSAVAYLKYSIGGRRSWLLISLAFLVMAVNQVVFGLFLSPTDVGVEEGAYLWIGGRLFAGSVLLVAALAEDEWHETGARTRVVYVRTAAFVLGGLVLVQGLVWASRNVLPPLVDRNEVTAPHLSAGFQPGLTPMDIALGLLGAGVFLTAAAAFSRERGPDAEARGWLAAALVLAAFAHLHYMLVPTIFTNHISTGDFLRLATSGVLLVALLVDVRRSYLQQRIRSEDLESAYEAERARVVQLEELERAKVDLLRLLSHELLHPVAAIRALSLGLARGGASMDEGQLRAVEGLVHQSEQLRDLVERAPDITELRLGSLALRRDRWKVDQILVHVRKTFVHLGERLVIERGRGLERAFVEIDLSRVMQVFHNLLSNAVKFSAPGTPVVIRADTEGSVVTFQVRDQGPGIPTDRVGSLFTPSPPRTTTEGKIGGLGVGLYISRLIVQAHGGEISASMTKSSEQGACIIFTIPLAGAV